VYVRNRARVALSVAKALCHNESTIMVRLIAVPLACVSTNFQVQSDRPCTHDVNTLQDLLHMLQDLLLP
jgi:hypothetical protein